ncbi:MAG: hypothetical protein R3B70_21985 [Polyangiaceae bacterium]
MNALTCTPKAGQVNIAMLFHEADRDLLQRLEVHTAFLSSANARIWHAGKMRPGQKADSVFRDELSRAHFILLLISADFIASFDHRLTGEVCACAGSERRVIPISARPCNWGGLPFFGLQPIPADGQPLTFGSDPEARFRDAASEIAALVHSLQSRSAQQSVMITVMNPTVVLALAQAERERHDLQLSLAEAMRTVPLGSVGVEPQVHQGDTSAADRQMNAVLFAAVSRIQRILDLETDTSKPAVVDALRRAAEQLEQRRTIDELVCELRGLKEALNSAPRMATIQLITYGLWIGLAVTCSIVIFMIISGAVRI